MTWNKIQVHILLFFLQRTGILNFSEAHPGKKFIISTQGEFYKLSKDILQTLLNLNYSHYSQSYLQYLQSHLHYLHSENDHESDTIH